MRPIRAAESGAGNTDNAANHNQQQSGNQRGKGKPAESVGIFHRKQEQKYKVLPQIYRFCVQGKKSG
jgi:hypothetical protein